MVSMSHKPSTTASTITAGALFDVLDVEIAALTQRIKHFLATGEGNKAELKREVERAFGMRALISKTFTIAWGGSDDPAAKVLFDRSGDAWDTLVALKHSF